MWFAKHSHVPPLPVPSPPQGSDSEAKDHTQDARSPGAYVYSQQLLCQ